MKEEKELKKISGGRMKNLMIDKMNEDRERKLTHSIEKLTKETYDEERKLYREIKKQSHKTIKDVKDLIANINAKDIFEFFGKINQELENIKLK